MADSGEPILGSYYGEWVERNTRNDAETNFKLTKLFKIIINAVYPVGSVYVSVKDVNPTTLFGGTWERLEDMFLLASGSTYTMTYDSDGEANKTGGEASHTLTTQEMPSHNHTYSTDPQYYNERETGSEVISPTSGESKFVTKSTNNTGGGQAHNNMPPYLVVNVWKRTA